jgi:hypothetical protein
MLWEGLRQDLTPDDRDLLDQLRRDEASGIGSAPDYYGCIVYTSFTGVVPLTA